jgi:hypothetical protein
MREKASYEWGTQIMAGSPVCLPRVNYSLADEECPVICYLIRLLRRR